MSAARRRVACLLLCSTLATVLPAQDEPTERYGSWMELDPTEWPHITLVNQIDYVDQHHPVAGCGFLLDNGDEVLAATAKHVLTYFKSASMDSVDFGGTLKRWRMFPKDRPTEVVVVDELVNRDPKETIARVPCEDDWLLFTVARASKKVQRLRLRATPLKPGEKVFVVGWRYPDEGPQRVIEGRYVRSEEGSVLISVEELADNTIPGLSGSPVLDAQGHVIGLMSRKAGKLQRLAPVAYPRRILKERAEAAGGGPDRAGGTAGRLGRG